MKEYMVIHPEVAAALAAHQPVVALESTIISHGMPYPDNVETALAVEEVIRQQGVVPATIAILQGKIHIGLTKDEIEYLGKATGVRKVSRRDFPVVLAKGLDGATTVAATMICAERAGIPVFVTGGIGGVHRGAETTMDISADLQELAHTNVAVVCAGAKSILDLGLTLEYLETFGVPVVGYQTEDFPAFFTRKSGYGVDVSAENPEDVAKMMKAKWDLQLHGGMVIANPIPEADAMSNEEMEGIIQQALQRAEAEGIKGKRVTPFLLSEVKEATHGRSLVANIALVKHNAVVGAAIAKAYAAL
ncbi:pseudouridine-5'-phosphate glycosidase [Rubeoparvulum massiliense]|uniref:pseudouridine-5'-phosphate glycosidase n=1 Tax=Rubeoparvulum massiliense TaxID=1631346 RepID=UPI00065DEB56|nr:pseudouridine-5'-phosphate glycosidase [Rubeoparvulum massiliense]